MFKGSALHGWAISQTVCRHASPVQMGKVSLNSASLFFPSSCVYYMCMHVDVCICVDMYTQTFVCWCVWRLKVDGRNDPQSLFYLTNGGRKCPDPELTDMALLPGHLAQGIPSPPSVAGIIERPPHSPRILCGL